MIKVKFFKFGSILICKSLNKEPQYKDYKEKEFENINGIKTIIGNSSDINIDSDVFMFEYDIKKNFI